MRHLLLAFVPFSFLALTGCHGTARPRAPAPTVGETDDEPEPAEVPDDVLLPPTPPGFVLPRPLLHVRMRAIVTANDDGSDRAPATPDGIAKAIRSTNAYFRAAGIAIEFDPARDVELKNSTLLNYDCRFSREALAKPRDRSPSCDKRPHLAARREAAERFPDRMVVFFRTYAKAVKFDDARGLWKQLRATGGYSSDRQPYVVVGPGPGNGTFLAHEIGHYLHLPHTFRARPSSVADAAELIRRYVEEEGHAVEEGLDVMDGDRNFVADTPPDAGGLIWKNAGIDKCGPTPSVAIPVRFRSGTTRTYLLAPDRHNLMSYFKDCRLPHGFSPQQTARMRDVLVKGNRSGIAFTVPPAVASREQVVK